MDLRSAILLASISVFCGDAYSATYYLATSGNDGNSCATAQAVGTPKATFSSAWGCLSAGDTLVVADGTYTSTSPPTGKAGSSGSVITIRAANDGGAVLSGGVTLRNNSYLEYQGFKVTSSGQVVDAGSSGVGLLTHHVTFRRCGFTTTNTNEEGGIAIGDGVHHMLFEDFWAWGGGRYTVVLYGGSGGGLPNTTADYNTFRRGVIRQGPANSSSGNPEASLALYYASNNIIENVIALDGNQDSNSSNAAFYLTGHAPPPNTSDNKFYGVIALNNKGVGWYVDVDNSEYAQNNAIYNSVIWKHPNGGVAFYANNAARCTGSIVDHVTSAENGDDGFWNYCTGTVVKSSIFLHNVYGMTQGGQGSMGTHNWNLLYNNTSSNYNNVTAGANDKTVNPSLQYIARIEAGTACSGAGESGSDCGANVTKRYQDGVLTATDLWPWPYEARIKKDMCTDAGVTTGFCAKSSLTEYVWTYLGGSNPYASGTTYTVTPSAGANGTISPNTAQTVNSGSTTQFTVTPSGGYTASVGGTCGGTLVGTTYTTNAITTNCTVSATFSDTTAPSVSISNADPSTISSDILNVYGTSSDSSGVTVCKWRRGSAPNAIDGTSCTGTTSFSCATSGYSIGSNAMYVGCSDAAGNYGSDSMTVSFPCKKLSVPSGLAFVGLTANPPSNATLSFDWADVTTHADGSALTGDLSNYRMYFGTTYGGPYNTASSVPSAVSVGPTLANVTYYARVAADSSVNSICNSDQSSEISMFADAIPPALSGLTPTGNYPKTSTSVSLGVTTNEAAICRYGAAGTSWASKTPFSSTGSTSHSATLSVWAGLVQRICYQCRDILLNESAESCTTFSVSAKPKVGAFN